MNKYISVSIFVVLISVSMATATFAQQRSDNPSMNSSAPAAKPATENVNAPAAAPQGSAGNPIVVRIEQPAPRRGAAKSGNGAVSKETAARKAEVDELRKQQAQWKADIDAKNLSQDERIAANEARITTLESRGVASSDPIIIELRKEIETIREAQESRDFWLWVIGITAFVALLLGVFHFFARSSSKNGSDNNDNGGGKSPDSPVTVNVTISVNGGPSGQPMTGSQNVDIAVNGKPSGKPVDLDNKQVQENAPVSASRPFPAAKASVESYDHTARRLEVLEEAMINVESRLDDADDDFDRLSNIVAKVGDKVADQGKQAQAGFDRLFAQLDSLVAAAASAPVTPQARRPISIPEYPPEDGVTVPFVAASVADVPARPAAPVRPASEPAATAPRREKKEAFQILEVTPSVLPLSGGMVRIRVASDLPVEEGGRIQCGASAYTTHDYEVLEGNVVEVLFKDHPRTMDYEANALKPIRVSYFSKDGKQATKADAIIFDDESAGVTPLEQVSDEEPAKSDSGESGGEPFNSAIADALKAAAAPAEPAKPESTVTTPKGPKGKNKAAAKA